MRANSTLERARQAVLRNSNWRNTHKSLPLVLVRNERGRQRSHTSAAELTFSTTTAASTARAT
jgi:hypothetical protein